MDSKWAAEQLDMGNKITKIEWDPQYYIVTDSRIIVDEQGKQWFWDTFDVLYTGWVLWKEQYTLTTKIDNAISFAGDVKVIPLADVKCAMQAIIDIIEGECEHVNDTFDRINELVGDEFLFKYM